ncbi:MAG: photosystem II stability/assembly factor-like protein [Kosmotoga sp.]|nr:MAG: photosystem II stability/assembly factor-like protein [Kosmotoga sp.]
MRKRLIVVFAMTLFLIFAVNGCVHISHPDDYLAWAVGQTDEDGKAMLLFSDDSGNSWRRQGQGILPVGKPLNDVFAVNSKEVWAVGSGSLVMRTGNSGDDWEIIELTNIASDVAFSCISVHEETIWLSGKNGMIISSTDDGESWSIHELPASASEYLIQGIHAIDNDLIYAVGNKSTPRYGIVLKTEDGGETWEEIILPNGYDNIGWIGVKATDKDHIVFHGGRGHYAVTANGGEQWVTGGPLFTNDINSLIMLDDSTYWAACDFDTIIRTSNAGVSWIEQDSTGTSNTYLLGIDALDGENALITGSSAGYPPFGKILRTEDGGQNWEVVRSATECTVPLSHVTIARKYN